MSARIEGSTRSISVQNEGVAAFGKSRSTTNPGPPTLADPSADLDLACGFAGLGIEALAAALQTESAQTMQKAARDCEKGAKEQQLAALDRQVDALHQKASDMRSEALVSGALTAAGGAMTIASVGAGTAGQPNLRLQSGGKTLAELAGPSGKLGFGGRQVDDEASSTKAAAEAKNAEAARDEWSAISKQAQQSMEKAQQALQSLVAERAAVRRSLLRGG